MFIPSRNPTLFEERQWFVCCAFTVLHNWEDEWTEGLPTAQILRLQACGACESVSSLHGGVGPLGGRWHRDWGVGHAAARAGDAAVLGQPTSPSAGRTEAGQKSDRISPPFVPSANFLFFSSPWKSLSHSTLPNRSLQIGRTKKATKGSWRSQKKPIRPRPLAIPSRRSQS